jgi:phosphopantothenoylcysteine synthetase/decarboxylase
MRSSSAGLLVVGSSLSGGNSISILSLPGYLDLMRCIVTAGPTYEPMDDVRRLTNFSTGRLGSELVNFLASKGHEVTLLIGQQATFRGERHAHQVQTFSTTTDLRERLRAFDGDSIDAVLHAAAVSDFRFGKIWMRTEQGELAEMKTGKVSTRQGTLLAELLTTPKIISELLQWFPAARLVGWKFEVDGYRAAVVRQAEKQLADCGTDACVANGPAYGPGFGLVRLNSHAHLSDTAGLFEALEHLLKQ